MSIGLDDLAELMEQLGSSRLPIRFSRLYALSDLSGERWATFQEAWGRLDIEPRRRLIKALVELAEASFEVNFDAILRSCLDDPDDIVRTTAIDGLWECEDVTLIGPLLSILRNDPSLLARAAAAEGLGHFVLAGELAHLEQSIQARIITELLTVLHLPEEGSDVRRRAIESVSYACLPEVLDALEAAYADDDEGMRVSALMGMGRSCDERWRAPILAEMGSESPAMRCQAAWAAGEVQIRAAVPLLAQLMDDPDAQVRDASIWALGQIGGQRARAILQAACETADEDTRTALEDALAEEALMAGEVDFPLYDTDGDLDDGDEAAFWAEDASYLEN